MVNKRRNTHKDSLYDVLDHFAEGCQIIGFDGRIIYLNEEAVRYFPIPKSQLIGRNMLEISPFSDNIQFQKCLKDSLEERIPAKLEIESQFANQNNKWFKLNFQPIPAGIMIVSTDITQQKKTEDLIRGRTGGSGDSTGDLPIMEWLLASQRISATGGWAIDMKTGRVWASPEARRIYGVDNRELSIESIRKFPLRKFRASLDEAMQEMLAGGKTYDVEFQISREINGEVVNIHSLAEFDREKNLVVGVIQDITARRAAENELRESEQKFRSFLEQSYDGQIISDEQGKIIVWNHAMEYLTGFTRKEVFGKTMWDLQYMLSLPNNQTKAHLASLKNLFSELLNTGHSAYFGKLFEGTLITKNGEQKILQQITFPMKTDQGYRVGEIFRDVTPMKKSQEQLFKLNQCLINFGPDPMENINRLVALAGELLEGDCALYNRLDSGLLCSWGEWHTPAGFNPTDNPQGHICYDVILKSDKEPIVIRHLEKTPYYDTDPNLKSFGLQTYIGQVVKFETQNVGSLCTVYKRDFVPKTDQLQILGIIASALAVEEKRKQAEDEIRKFNEHLEKLVRERTNELQKANEEMEAFSYSVSHDLRAPLRSINGFTRILVEDYARNLDEEALRVCTVIQDNALRMGNLIDDLLAFSRLNRTEMLQRTVDMNLLVTAAYNEIQEPNQNRIIDLQVEHLCEAYGDPTLLKQVWINLISNAIKYSSIRETSMIHIYCTRQDQDCIYGIRDNGIGFDMQFSNKLFGVFQRLHSVKQFEGTGVGLAIVKRIISRHGGKVWAEGEPDHGAIFYFSLPIVKTPRKAEHNA